MTDWRTRFLSVATDPSIAYVLILLGIYALVFAISNPGLVFPGVVGAICVLIALYAFHLLPVNYAGLALMLVGIAFMTGELFFPAYGSLGIGGAIAFVIGSVILIDTDVPGFGVPFSLVLGLAAGTAAFLFLVVALLVLFILLVWAFRILREYERGVVFNLGRYWAVKGPGWFILIPVIQQMVKMDLRTVVLDVPPQGVITRDNVSVKVNAVVYFRVIDPQKAVIQVADFLTATNLLAQTTLRAVLGKHELDALLAEREQLNLDIQKTLDAQTETWGIKVSNVEIKDVDLNETLVRAIARQAEAERERRAKVIHAEGEPQASEKLLQAAQMLSKQAEAMQLRYLQTLSNIAGDKTSTIVFPVPMDLITPLLDALKKRAS